MAAWLAGTLSWITRYSYLLLISGLGLVSPALAGGGPENVLLVVNSRSWASLSIANYYSQMREIPPGNIIYLDWDEQVETTDINRFRNKLLKPVMEQLQSRGIASQIDYIVYSADFPYAAHIGADLKGQPDLPKQITPIASTNGLTYLWQRVLKNDPNYVRLDVNRYMPVTGGDVVPSSQGFQSWLGWTEHGRQSEIDGEHYMLSTMLGLTGVGRGNSFREVIRYLEAARSADGTQPRGTIYFVRNNDVRSQARDANFDRAAAALTSLGVRAEVITGDYPQNRNDIQGATLGTHTIRWNGSNILPGAIVEHLTSYGGILTEGTGQSPLTLNLRFGAAGASGTVTEPYAIAAKFPSPYVHVHYARGCTLAESFYQSVLGPYQLLIVGDPLCRPWASVPEVTVTGLRSGARLSGSVELVPQARTRGAEVDRFELFVDGQRWASCPAGESFTLDTVQLLDGYHELRVVGIERSQIQSQGRIVLPVTVDNHGGTARLSAERREVRWGEPVELQFTSPGALGAAIYHDSRLLGTITGAEGSLTVEPQSLGLGPVRLRAVALGDGATQKHVLAAPLMLMVEPGIPLPGSQLRGLSKGLLVQAAGGSPRIVETLSPTDWLKRAEIEPNQSFTLEGIFQITDPDVYQFLVRYKGKLQLSVDGQMLLDATETNTGKVTFVPVTLGTGWHEVVVRVEASPEAWANVRFGGEGTQSLSAERFFHSSMR